MSSLQAYYETNFEPQQVKRVMRNSQGCLQAEGRRLLELCSQHRFSAATACSPTGTPQLWPSSQGKGLRGHLQAWSLASVSSLLIPSFSFFFFFSDFISDGIFTAVITEPEGIWKQSFRKSQQKASRGRWQCTGPGAEDIKGFPLAAVSAQTMHSVPKCCG